MLRQRHPTYPVVTDDVSFAAAQTRQFTHFVASPAPRTNPLYRNPRRYASSLPCLAKKHLANRSTDLCSATPANRNAFFRAGSGGQTGTQVIIDYFCVVVKNLSFSRYIHYFPYYFHKMPLVFPRFPKSLSVSKSLEVSRSLSKSPEVFPAFQVS